MLQNGYWCSVAVQIVSEPDNCQDAGFILRAGARVRMQVLEGFVMGAGCCKNHDKQLTHIVRVSGRILLLSTNVNFYGFYLFPFARL
jgi:hypothetical protein